MLKMGDNDLYTLCGVKAPAGRSAIADDLLYSARDVAVMMWMASHYIADGHMPFHCDNRNLASTSSKQNAHSKIEDLWGDQVPALFKASTVLSSTSQQILAEPLPSQSNFKGIAFETDIPPLKNGGDPWKEVGVLLVAVDFHGRGDQPRSVQRPRGVHQRLQKTRALGGDGRLVGHGPDHHTGAVLVARGQLGSGDFAGEPPGYVLGSPSTSARQRAT
jgi:hypothetical protein